jgi:flotillin
VKPADAQAYATRVRAEADRDASIAAAEAEAKATKLTGEADGAAIEARGLARAKATEAASAALARNQDAVIAQQLAEQMPSLVQAAAHAFDGVDNLTVLNGAQGISEILTQVMAQGGSAMRIVQQMLDDARSATSATNGHVDAVVAPVAPAPDSQPPAAATENETPAVFDADAAAAQARDADQPGSM